MVIQRMSFGFICTDEDFNAVQRRPTPAEQVVIDDYRDRYEKAMGFQPHGFHYFPFPDEEETLCVWLPIEESLLLKPLQQSAGHDLTMQR